MTHFQVRLQLRILYITEYVHDYYTLLSCTYVLYITAALNFLPECNFLVVCFVVVGKMSLSLKDKNPFGKKKSFFLSPLVIAGLRLAAL